MTIEIKRYAIGVDSAFRASIDENANGKWCKWEDVKALLERTEKVMDKILSVK